MDSQTIRAALGELQEDPDRQEAWHSLKDALRSSNGDLAAPEALHLLAAARSAHAERGEVEAVAALLGLETHLAAGTADEAALVVEQARVHQEGLFDEDGALAAHIRVLELAPDEPNANTAVVESEEKRERWQELTRTYLEEASGAPDDVYKSSMLMRAAEMELRFAGDQLDLNRVTQRLHQSLDLDPANERAAKMLERIYRRAGKWEDVARVLERAGTRASEASVRIAAKIRLARLLKNRLDDAQAAAQAYERVLEEDSSNTEAKEFLTTHYSSIEQWDALVSVYERELRAADRSSPDRLGDMLQIAMLHWKKRGRAEDAEPWFEQIRALEPANAGMLEFFREHCEQIGDQGRWLNILTAAHRALPDGEQKTAVATEMAELADQQKDAQKAIEQYKSILRQEPDNAEARAKLKDLYRRTQGYNALVELLRQELERADSADIEQRLTILREVASVYRRFIKSDTALVSVLNQIVQLKDDDTDAVRELITLYDKLGRYRDLLANQQRLAELSEDPDEKARLYRSVGRRWIDQFSNVQNATQAFEALLRLLPEDREARENLEALYKKRRAWPALYELYRSQLERVEGGQKLALMRKLAQLAAERLQKGDEAAELYKEILAIEPDNIEVLDALEKHAERAKDWSTLAEALERRVEMASDDDARLAVLQKLGTVYADHLGDPSGAVRAWRRVLELQPGHHRALRVLRDSYLVSGDYDGLEELYGSQGDYEGLADVLSNAADRAKDPKAKVELSYRAADVYTQRLEQPDRAFRSYERILATDPDDAEAARRLVPLYEEDEKWTRLVPLYELLYQKAASDAERLAHLQKLVDVVGHRLGDRARAVEYARQAYELSPDDDETVERFEAAAAQAGAWESFAEALEARAKKLKKKKAQRRVLQLKLARIYAEQLGKTDQAISVYERLLESDPADAEAAEALEAILRREKRPNKIRWLLGLRVENAASDEQRTDLLLEWANTEELTFDAPDEAARLYRRVLELSPANAAAIRTLPRLLLSSGDAAGAAEVLETHRGQVAEGDRVELEALLSELYLDRLDRPADALDAAVRTLELSEHDSRAIAVLERLVQIGATKERAAEVLAREYAAMGNARDEADALGAMLQAATDRGERLALYQKLASVHEEKLESFNAALDVILRAVRELPTELSLWERADSLATRSGRPTDLAEAYREALGAELPEDVEMALCEQAARLHTDRLGDPAGASPYLERILRRDPANEQAFSQLKQILTSSERWPELEALYDRTSQATDDPTAQIEMLAEVALVCEEIIEEPAKAIRYYERILTIEPGHESAMTALDRLYEQQEMHAELASLLDRRLGTAVGDDRTDIKLRLGRIQLEKLHQPGQAVDHVEDVLRERPNDYDARQLAERLLEIGDYRARAARMLEHVYEERDEVRDLVRVLAIRLEELDRARTGDNEAEVVEDRKELLRRIATLRDERLHEDEGALDALAKYVPLDPLDVDARHRLVAIGERAGAQARVAEVLLSASERADTPGMQGEILMQVARINEEQLADVSKAEETYRRVLEIDPDDAALALPAARALERVYSASEQHDKLADILKVQIRLEEDVEARRELMGRLGTLSETVLDDSDSAIEAWRARLEENPGDEESLAALDRLYERAERWRDLVQILENRQDRVEQGDERRSLMRRAAEVLATKLDTPADAIDVWRAIVDEFGPDAEALGALETLYQAAGRWEELADTVESHLDITDDQTERLELLARLGDLRRLRLSNPSGALDVYREALTIDTTHEPSRNALEQLLEADDALSRREAAEVLHPIYEAEGNNARWLKVLEVEIDASEDPLARIEGLQKAIQVADGAMGDAARAFGYADRAVREAAGHADVAPWLEELERLAAATGQRSDQVELLKQIVPDIFDGDIQFDVMLKIASLARHELGEKDLAREYYQKALEQRPDDRTALTALESLYEQADDVASLLDILERRADISESDEEKKQLLFRRARLLADRMEDRPRAIDVYQSLLDVDLDPAAVDALETLYGTEERWSDLVELYERQLDAPGAAVADLRVKIARVLARHLNDVMRAFDEVEAALEIDRQHEGAVAELERILGDGEAEAQERARAAELLEPIYLVRADYDRVMSTISARLDASDDPDERRELLTRLAQLHEEQKEDYEAALDTVAKLLHEDLSDEGTISELERLAKVAGAEKRLAEIYAAELADIEGDEPATANLSRRTGELLAALGENDRALSFYRRALAFEPENDELFSAVDGLLERLERPEERVELYKTGLEHRFEPGDRSRFLHTIARLQRQELGRPEDAIDTYREAVDVDERDGVALDALTELYAERERWDDLAELYLRRAEMVESPSEAATYRLALARMLRAKIRDAARAIDQLEEIVRMVPSSDEAVSELESLKQEDEHRERIVEILRPLYEESDDWRRLIKLNEDRFELAGDVSEKVGVLRETAELWEQRGSDPERARRALAVAFELDPDDPEVRADYERLCAATGAWDELTETYDSVLVERPDLADKAELLGTLARVHDEQRNDPRRALDAYDRLRELEQSDLEILEKMEQLATLLSDWASLVGVLTAKADLVLEDEERASIWRQVGESKRDMLEDRDGAIEAYERAADLDPGSAFTLDNLIELYEEKGDPERLVDLYQQRVELADDEDADLKYDLLTKAATCFEKQIDDRMRAIEVLGQALAIRAGDPEVLESLNRLYRAEEMWPELLDNLKLQASSAETPESRAGLRKQIAQTLAIRLESFDEALEAYGLVLEEVPDDAEVRKAVRKIGEEHEELRSSVAEILIPVLRSTGRYDELVDVLEMRLTVETDPMDRGATLRTIAEVLDSELHRPADALGALLRALTEQPDARDLHEEIERLSETSGGFSRYAESLSERAQATFDADLAKDLFSRLGRICEEKLNDDARAVDAYGRAVDQVGDQPELLEALDRLYGRLGDADKLSEVLERRTALVESDAEQGEIYYRMAVLQIRDFEDAARGLGSLRMALERVPEHERAQEELEKLTEDRDLFEEAAEILEGVYRARGQKDRLASLYEKRVRFAQTPEERIDMRRNLARVLEDEVGDPAGAQRVLQQGFSDDPADTALLDEIERLAAVTGDWGSAAAALGDAIEQKADLLPDAARELCVRVAAWYRDRAGDPESAEKALARALEYDPNSDEVLVELEALQTSSGRERDLIETLRRRAKLQLDEDQRQDLYRRAKELADGIDDRKLAESILRELLSLDDANLWALEGLTALREASGDSRETLTLLKRRAELVPDETLRRELSHRAAALARESLGDSAEAIELYSELFETDPTDPVAANALRALYQANERWEDLARLIERLIDVAEDPTSRNTLRMELSSLNMDRFESLDTAVELLRTVLEEEPGRSDAVVRLSELYEQAGRDEELADLLSRQIDSAREAGDTDAELKFEVRLGEVYETRLQSRDKAIETYRNVLDRDPRHRGALEALARLYRSAEDHARAAETLSKLLDVSSGEEVVALSMDLADEHEQLGDKSSAAAALERGLGVGEWNADLRERLKGLYETTETWDRLAELIAGDAEAAEGIDAKIGAFKRAATIHADKRGDPAAAAALLERAVELKPEDRPLMLELCDAYSASGRGKEAVGVLEKIVESYGGKRSKELGEIHRRLARAYLADGETARALEELDKAFRIEPGNVHVLKELGQVSLDGGDLKKAQQMFRALLLQKLDDKSPITKAEVFMNLGDVHHRLGEKQKAVQMLERAVQTDASLERAKELLAQVKG